jgi:ferredoxin-NADP reductase
MSSTMTGERARSRVAGREVEPAPARRWAGNVFALAAGAGFVAILAMVAGVESRAALAAPGGWWLAAGRVFGFAGAYLMLVMILLTARLPLLERVIGQDRLVGWHRRIAPYPLSLIALHIVTITLGYAAMTTVGPLHQLWVFLRNYPDMLMALVGFGLLLTAGFSSIRKARRKMKYETWWVVHLYTYLALSLAFAHQVATGVMFKTHLWNRLFWIALWAGTAGVVIAYRVVTPLLGNLRHQLRVAEVTEVAPGVLSLTFEGRHLEQLRVSGGQFFQWRFLARDLWWHSHPYSLSALPNPPYLRVTVKGVGDQSSALAHLKPGTRVLAEGPYGRFTAHARRGDRVALIGAGVGVTPLRALLEDLPDGVDVAVIVRASSAEDLVHRDELDAMVKSRQGRLHEVIGSRHQTRFDAKALRRLVPDLARRDVYVCGPAGFTDQVVVAAVTLGVRPDRLHQETFTF